MNQLENNGYLSFDDDDGDLFVRCKSRSKAFKAGVYQPGIGGTKSSLIALSFEAAPSPLSIQFRARMLSALVADAQVKPLVKFESAGELLLIYRDEGDEWNIEHPTERYADRAWQHGLAFADSYAAAHLMAVRTPIALEGSWAADRTPLNVRREDLPIWNPVNARDILQALIDSFGDDMRVKGAYGPQRAPTAQTEAVSYNITDQRVRRVEILKVDIERAKATGNAEEIDAAQHRFYAYLMAPPQARV